MKCQKTSNKIHPCLLKEMCTIPKCQSFMVFKSTLKLRLYISESSAVAHLYKNSSLKAGSVGWWTMNDTAEAKTSQPEEIAFRTPSPVGGIPFSSLRSIDILKILYSNLTNIVAIKKLFSDHYWKSI